jgi:hypothetical protein
VVSKISQFMHSLRTSYLEAINRVLRYLNRIPGKGILINKIMSLMRFGGYTNTDWIESCDPKFTIDYYTFVGENIIT